MIHSDIIQYEIIKYLPIRDILNLTCILGFEESEKFWIYMLKRDFNITYNDKFPKEKYQVEYYMSIFNKKDTKDAYKIMENLVTLNYEYTKAEKFYKGDLKKSIIKAKSSFECYIVIRRIALLISKLEKEKIDELVEFFETLDIKKNSYNLMSIINYIIPTIWKYYYDNMPVNCLTKTFNKNYVDDKIVYVLTKI